MERFIPQYQADSEHEECRHWNAEKFESAHVLTKVMADQVSWKNIATPVGAVLEKICNVIIQKDIDRHAWKIRLAKRHAMTQRALILIDRKFKREIVSLDEQICKLNKKIDWENGNMDWQIKENCM